MLKCEVVLESSKNTIKHLHKNLDSDLAGVPWVAFHFFVCSLVMCEVTVFQCPMNLQVDYSFVIHAYQHSCNQSHSNDMQPLSIGRWRKMHLRAHCLEKCVISLSLWVLLLLIMYMFVSTSFPVINQMVCDFLVVLGAVEWVQEGLIKWNLCLFTTSL